MKNGNGGPMATVIPDVAIDPVSEKQKVFPLVAFLRASLVKSDMYAKAFARRYSTQPEVYATFVHQHSNMRRFVIGEHVAEMVEFMRKDKHLTARAIVYLDNGNRQYIYDTMLEAEVAIADYLADKTQI